MFSKLLTTVNHLIRPYMPHSMSNKIYWNAPDDRPHSLSSADRIAQQVSAAASSCALNFD